MKTGFNFRHSLKYHNPQGNYGNIYPHHSQKFMYLIGRGYKEKFNFGFTLGKKVKSNHLHHMQSITQV